MKKLILFVAIALPVLFTACNNDNKKTENNSTSSQTSNAPANTSNTIEISGNDSMKFSTIELNVKANEKVTLTMRNVGSMPKTAMGHDWVLLKDNTNLDDFAKAANTSPDYIPANNPNIIAHTKLLGPGESDTIEFTVPPGSYTYICTFPGHYKTMMGILTAY